MPDDSTPAKLNWSRLIGIVAAVAVLAVIGWQLFTTYQAERKWEERRVKGDAAYETGDFAEAEVQLEQSLEAARQLGDQDPRLDETLNRLGDVREVQGKFNDTEYLYLQSLQSRIARFGPISQPVAEVQAKLGNAYLLQNELIQAEGLFNQAIDTYDQLGAADRLAAASAHVGLGRTLAAQGKLDKAEVSLRRALKIQEESTDADKVLLALTYRSLASVVEKRGDGAEATTLRDKAGALAPIAEPTVSEPTPPSAADVQVSTPGGSGSPAATNAAPDQPTVAQPSAPAEQTATDAPPTAPPDQPAPTAQIPAVPSTPQD